MKPKTSTLVILLCALNALAALTTLTYMDTHWDARMGANWVRAFIPVLGLIPLACLVATITLIRRYSRKLDLFSKATQHIAHGNYDLRIPATGGQDAISRLSQAFNEMAKHLKLAKEQLQEQQLALAESSKMSALGEMASGVAHEVNNPLAIARLRVNQLKEILESEGTPDSARLKDIAEQLEASILRISTIVKSLRAFARDASTDPFHPVKVQTIIDDTLELCRQRFRAELIDLFETPTSPELMVECRPIQLSQVLLNLLNNSRDAIEFMDEKWIRIEAIDGGEEIQIRVTDSGRGIAPELRAKIFEPFFTTKEVGKGMGLGLSLSKGVVESHGGALECTETGGHTCFVIRLPKRQAKTGESPQEDHDQGVGSSSRKSTRAAKPAPSVPVSFRDLNET